MFSKIVALRMIAKTVATAKKTDHDKRLSLVA